MIHFLKNLKSNFIYLKVKKVIADNNLETILPAHLKLEKKKFHKPLKYLNDFYYFLLNTSHIDESCYIADLYLKNKFDEAMIYNYFASLLLSSPKTYSSQKYLQEILKYTDKYIPYNPNKLNLPKIRLDPNKKLKVGYICHFFSNNISESTLWPWILNHDNKNFDVYVLSDDRKANVSANNQKKWEEFKSKVNFFDTSDFGVDDFCKFVKENEFDVVLELNGHCSVARYKEINLRIAPVQISFYNIAGPSGIRNIDYVFCEKSMDLGLIKNAYTEKFYPLASSTAIKFFDYYPQVSEAPFKKNNYITFGSFGAAHKIHKNHFKLWCEILKQVPNSRFLMKASALDNIDIRIAWEKFFHDNGISSDRFRLEGFEVHQEMLKKYHEVDIALDTFPHGAGSTTNDALYMGVPVIGLNGERFCSQHAKIIIGTIGHMELVAQNEEEYVKKAVDLANNPEMLIHYRKTLRDDYMNSPKADLKACTKALEEAYRDMWVQYVKENS